MRSIARRTLAIGCWVLAAFLFTFALLADTTTDSSDAGGATAPGSKKSELTEEEKELRDWEKVLLGTWIGTSFLNQTKLSFTPNRQYRYDYSLPGQDSEVGEWRIETGPDLSKVLVYKSRKVGTQSVESIRSQILGISKKELKLRPLAPADQNKIVIYKRVQRV